MNSKFLLSISILFFSSFSFSQTDVTVTSSQAQVLVQPLDSSFLFYDFGVMFVNSKRYVRYDVTNTGTSPLLFRSADISGSFEFDGYHSCSAGLQPRQKCIFEISYWPINDGFDYGRFSIAFSGNNTIVVDLRGQGIR